MTKKKNGYTIYYNTLHVCFMINIYLTFYLPNISLYSPVSCATFWTVWVWLPRMWWNVPGFSWIDQISTVTLSTLMKGKTLITLLYCYIILFYCVWGKKTWSIDCVKRKTSLLLFFFVTLFSEARAKLHPAFSLSPLYPNILQIKHKSAPFFFPPLSPLWILNVNYVPRWLRRRQCSL